MTLNLDANNAQLASINRKTGTVSTYPVRIAQPFNTYPYLRDLAGLVVKDDTIYAGFQNSPNCSDVRAGILRLSTLNPQDDSTVFANVSDPILQPGQLAKTSRDDTLVLTTYNCGGSATPPKQILVASPSSKSTSTRPMPWYSLGATAGDDTIYVSQSGGNGLAAINPENLDDSRIVAVTGAGTFQYTSVWQDPSDIADDTVFLPDNTKKALWLVNGRTLIVDDSIAFDAQDPAPTSVSVARSNLAYAAGGTKLWAVGIVSGESTPSTGVQDDSVTIRLNLPEPFTVTAPLIEKIRLDDDTDTTTFEIVDDTSLKFQVPPGTGGPYSVIVELNGDNRIKVGEFTYRGSNPPTPPAPAPPAPAMTPISQVINGVVGTAIPPTSRFTLENFSLFPRYSVYPQLPDGLAIDPATGVVSGTSTVVYPSTRHWITASAGGNSESASSTLQVTINPAPTPPPPPPVTRSLVLNQGERTKAKASIHDRITTTGSSTGIEPGTRLTPYIRYSGQTAFSEGRATIVVQADGTFRWTREIRRNRDVTGYVAYEDLKSNEVTWVRLR